MNKKRPIKTHIHRLDIKNVWDEEDPESHGGGEQV